MSTERRYDPKSVEPKWQALWERERTWEVSNDDAGGDPFYVLEMLPYPSRRPAHGSSQELCGRGRGRALPAPRRARGCSIPSATTRSACRRRTTRSRAGSTRASRPRSRSRPSTASSTRGACRSTGRASSPPTSRSYYRWTQWIFLKLYERGLAYRAEAAVNWCPSRRHRARQRAGHRRPLRALRLAGRGAPARAVVLPHHRLRRPPARRPRPTSSGPRTSVTMQRNWIGRSEGAEVQFSAPEMGVDYPVFTTRPDTLFGATFFVMAPEHPDVLRLAEGTEHEAGGPRLRQPRADRVPRGPRRRRAREDRRAARPLASSTRSTASASRCGSPTTC